jgi:NADPH:quinone reductase-like Zn-dependent oxidoreductase
MSFIFKSLKVLVAVLVTLTLVVAVMIGYTSDCVTPSASAASDQSMRAVTYSCYGGPEILQLSDVEKPIASNDEIVVRVKAASVNPLDWHYMRGSPFIMRLMVGLGSPNDKTMGVDFAGVVESVGPDVTRFKPGDEVFGGRGGAFADYIKMPETRGVTHKPDNISFEQAAAVPIAAVSALQALRDSGEVKTGQNVLINGASGGVGTFAVQIAKAFGAQVTGVCSTRNIELVKSFGADKIVNYKKEDFVEQGILYDLIIDNVGNRSIGEYQAALKDDGILVMVGGPKGDWIGPFKNSIMSAFSAPFTNQKLRGFLATMNKEDLAVLAEMMRSGQLVPAIDKRFSLDQIQDAVRYSESGRARGKIIITM